MSIAAYLRENGAVERVEVADEAAVEKLLGGKVESVDVPGNSGLVAYRRKSVSDAQPNPGANYVLRAEDSVGEYVVTDGDFKDLPGADLLWPAQ